MSNPEKLDPQGSMADMAEDFAPGEAVAVDGRGPKYLKELYGEQLERLPKKYQNILMKLCQGIAMRDQFARIEEVKRAATQRFYWRNMMDVIWNESSALWNQPYNGMLYNSDSDASDINLRYPLNIYQAFGRGFISLVSQVPAVRFSARGETPNSLKISSGADAMRRKIETQNDADKIMEDTARLFWTDGRVVFYSRWVCDGARFGYDDQGHPDEAQEGIGSEGEAPEKKPREPKGGEVITPFGVLEAKVPVNMRDQADFPFVQISFEIDITSAKSLYPLIADQLLGGTPGPGEYNFDRTTRIATTQGIQLLTQSGDTIAQLPTYQRTWMRPSMYAEIEKQDRQFFIDNFPDGIFVAFIGDTYCESRNESMDDHITVCHPLPGDGQSTPSCGALIMPVQDALNDMFDLRMETYMKAIPAIWVSKQVANLQAISAQKAEPGAHLPALETPGQPTRDGFFVEPTPALPADAVQMGQELFGDIPQFLTGLYPAALGGSDQNNQTLGGILTLQNQSKGQAGVAWRALRKAYAKAMRQLVRLGAYFRMAEAENGYIRIANPGEAEVEVDLEDLRSGNLWCYPDGDESYPNTHADRRAAYQALMQQAGASPAVQAILAEPKNQILAKDMLGLPDLVIPGANSAEKQLAEIEQLLGEPPVPNQQALAQYMQAVMMAQASGQPVPPQPPPEQMLSPSVPIDVDFDEHEDEWETVKDWVNGPTGQEAKRSNPDGYMNVRLHGLLHKQQVDQAQQQAAQQALAPQLALEQAKHSGQAKSPSESINFKDLGPSGQLQVAKQAGLDISADVGAELAEEQISPPPQKPQ